MSGWLKRVTQFLGLKPEAKPVTKTTSEYIAYDITDKVAPYLAEHVKCKLSKYYHTYSSVDEANVPLVMDYLGEIYHRFPTCADYKHFAELLNNLKSVEGFVSRIYVYKYVGDKVSYCVHCWPMVKREFPNKDA